MSIVDLGVSVTDSCGSHTSQNCDTVSSNRYTFRCATVMHPGSSMEKVLHRLAWRNGLHYTTSEGQDLWVHFRDCSPANGRIGKELEVIGNRKIADNSFCM